MISNFSFQVANQVTQGVELRKNESAKLARLIKESICREIFKDNELENITNLANILNSTADLLASSITNLQNLREILHNQGTAEAPGYSQIVQESIDHFLQTTVRETNEERPVGNVGQGVAYSLLSIMRHGGGR